MNGTGALNRYRGFKLAEVIGRPLWDVQFQMALEEKKTPEAYARLKTMLTGLLKTGEAPMIRQPVDWNILRPDGTQRFVQTVTFSVKISHGFMLAGFILDVTERRQAQEAVERLQHQIELILNSAGEGILGLDTRGNHTFINPAAARMLGYEAEELLGISSHKTWHHSKPDGSPYPVEECPIHASYRNGIPHMAENEMFWRKDGSSFPVDYTSTPIFAKGEISGAVVTFNDITERKACGASSSLKQKITLRTSSIAPGMR